MLTDRLRMPGYSFSSPMSHKSVIFHWGWWGYYGEKLHTDNTDSTVFHWSIHAIESLTVYLVEISNYRWVDGYEVANTISMRYSLCVIPRNSYHRSFLNHFKKVKAVL